tara:strand:- start:96 stop:497 length:402 start_codon:yes stop_codon:yes gene_type:complete
MGYLSIKNLDENKINIQNTNNYYSLSYKQPYIKLSSILIELNNISVSTKNGYYITIKDERSINELKKLDSFLIKHIFNYKGILHENNSEYYLYLKKNDYLDNFMKDFTNEKLYINIIKLKKTASYIFPIVYVL